MQALAAKHPWRFDVPLLLAVSIVLLAQGLTMPAMEIRAFFFWRDQYSILANIEHLFEHKRRAAAIILAAGSVVYPAVKIVGLLLMWILPFPAWWRRVLVRALRLLGRWSMVDVAAVAAIVVGSRVIGPLNAKPLPGVYIYAVGIIILMIATILMDRLTRRDH